MPRRLFLYSELARSTPVYAHKCVTLRGNILKGGDDKSLMGIYQRQPVKFHYGEIQGKKYGNKHNNRTDERQNISFHVVTPLKTTHKKRSLQPAPNQKWSGPTTGTSIHSILLSYYVQHSCPPLPSSTVYLPVTISITRKGSTSPLSNPLLNYLNT